MKILSANNKQPIVRKMSPGYSRFDLSHSHKLSGDMGQLIPICTLPVMPGDRVNIGVEGVIRFMSMIAPPLHEVWATIDYYYVPYRIVDETFVDFITGGEDGLDTTSPPRWNPSNINKTVEGTLWDHLGYPTNIIPSVLPVSWIKRAYNKIWNWNYRNQNIQAEVDEDTNEDLLLANWENDYFTSALLEQQRGIAPALPITGIINAVWPSGFSTAAVHAAVDGSNLTTMSSDGVDQPGTASTKATLDNNTVAILKTALDNNSIDLSGATTFDIADIREALQIQRFMEITARSGVHFNQFLEGMYNVSPLDKTLQEPEFIGRVNLPVLMDEVVQTAPVISGSTPLGNLGGKAIAVGSSYAGSIRIEEPGVIIGIMVIRPKPAYQQGINRAWLIQSKYDYPFPVFANLSEQLIKVGELFNDGTADNLDFGYTGRYDEYRIMHDSVHGLLKKTSSGFSHWHMGRIFASEPALNTSFIQCDCSAIKARIMAVPSEPTFVANIGNQINVKRALPLFANPSIMERI